MTTTTAWDRFRDDVRTATVASAVEQFERLTWNSERIHQAQRDSLRTLLHHAAEHSPFHRRRLAGIDAVINAMRNRIDIRAGEKIKPQKASVRWNNGGQMPIETFG